MRGTVSRRAVCIAVVALILASFAVWAFQPWVEVRVHQELTRPDDRAITLLHQEAPLQDIKVAVRTSGKHVDQMSYLGGSLLYHAVATRRIDVARWLIEQGANPNGIHREGVPLEKAIRQEDVAMVKLLIGSGADPDFEMGYDVTPRKCAIELGNPEVLSELPSRDLPRTAPATLNSGN